MVVKSECVYVVCCFKLTALKLLYVIIGAYVYTSIGKPRIGLLNVEGKALGFIFIETTSSLSVLRHAIDDQVPFCYLLVNLV